MAKTWVEVLFGLDLDGWTGDGTWSLEWGRAPRTGDGWLLIVFAAAAVLAGLAWLYRRDAGHLPAGRRRLLSAARAAVLAGLAMVILEPRLVLERREDLRSSVLVLVDASSSMSLAGAALPDGTPAAVAERLGFPAIDDLVRAPREEIARRVLDGGVRNRLEAAGVAVEVRPFTDRIFSGVAALDAAGPAARQATALGTVLELALAGRPAHPRAGILVLSDGRSNTGPDPGTAAEAAGRAGTKVHVLPLGHPVPERNLRVLGLVVNPVVFIRDPVEIAVPFEIRGLETGDVTVVLEVRRGGGPFQEIDRQTLPLPEGGGAGRAVFTWRTDEPDEFEFRAAISPVEGERTAGDNAAIAPARAIRPELRVLLVAGHAFPEVQFLVNTLLRDPGIDVSAWLQSAEEGYRQKGDTRIDRLPAGDAELAAYDAVILYDPDLSVAPEGFAATLARFVGEAGGGLVYISGESFTRGLFDREPPGADDLLAVLPVIREPGLFVAPSEARLHARDDWRLEVTAAGREDPILRFAAEAAGNDVILLRLPGMYWHFPVTKARPGAHVLARHGDVRMANAYGRHVVFAAHRYGPGSCLFLACDSTYRWRTLDEQAFDGFWARVVDRAGKAHRLGGIHPLVVATDRESVRAGMAVRIEARFRAFADGGALASLAAQIETGDVDAVPVTLRAVPGRPGEFEAEYVPSRAGLHLVKVWPAENPQERARAATARFEVQAADRESEAPTADRAALEAVARASGGRVFELTEIDRIPEVFAARRLSVVHRQRQELWDAPLLAGAILAALITEWILRKRWGLS